MKYIEELEQERQGKLDIETAEEIYERIAKEEIIVELKARVKTLEDRFDALIDNLNKGMAEMNDELNAAFSEVNNRLLTLEQKNPSKLIGLR